MGVYQQTKSTVIGLNEVPKEETNKYGVIASDDINSLTSTFQLKDIVDKINSQECPIEEPGLEELIKEHSNRISATTDFSIIQECDVIIVTVGTPLGKDYKPDKSQIEGAMSSICKFLNEDQSRLLNCSVFYHKREIQAN